MLKIAFRWIMVLFYIVAGFNHFRVPDLYMALMPPYLPYPRGLIYISGVAEIFGGLGVANPLTRRPAAWGLIALLIAVFPANIHVALHGFGNVHPLLLWLRLPLQIVLIAWVWWTCLEKQPPAAVRH
jgi:uncharacterized membrane protein